MRLQKGHLFQAKDFKRVEILILLKLTYMFNYRYLESQINLVAPFINNNDKIMTTNCIAL